MDFGYMGKFLIINLSNSEFKNYSIPEKERKKYIGGKGLAAKILYDELPPNIDPLSNENIIVFTTGPLTGTGAPCSSRFNVSSKSPLTGLIASSNSGGNFGIGLKQAGYDGLIIKGSAEKPVIIEINDEEVKITPAEELWTLDTEEIQQKLPKNAGKVVIGRAGENLVKFASIISGHRASGRCGMGAVMGSKKIKAIIAYGNKKVQLANEENFRNIAKNWSKILKSHPTTGQSLPKFGTAGFINICNEAKILPTKNFSSGHFEHADEISGETLAEKFLIKNTGCKTCPIRCGRVVKYNDKEIKGPEYETIGLLGSNLLERDMNKIIEWNYLCDIYGMDTISTGSVIGFVKELCKKGMLPEDVTKGGQIYKWGDNSDVSQMIKDIALREGFGDEMANGTKYLSEKYGGKEFAIHSKGLEIAAYDPRGAVGHGLGYATANRGGCHIGGGYCVYLEANGPVTIDPLSTRSKPELVILMQNMLDAVSSMGTCIFTTYAIFPSILNRLSDYAFLEGLVKQVLSSSGFFLRPILKSIKYLKYIDFLPPIIPYLSLYRAATGDEITLTQFLETGERIFNTERMINLREKPEEKDTLPQRLLNEPITENPDSIVKLDKMLPRYYRIRGWNENGIPKHAILKKLGIK